MTTREEIRVRFRGGGWADGQVLTLTGTRESLLQLNPLPYNSIIAAAMEGEAMALDEPMELGKQVPLYELTEEGGEFVYDFVRNLSQDEFARMQQERLTGYDQRESDDEAE